MESSSYLVIFLLCGTATLLLGHRYKRELPIGPKDIGDKFADGLPSVIKSALGGFDITKLVSQTVECIEDNMKKNNFCNFNVSFDPIVHIRTCAKQTGFDELAEEIMKLFPTVDLTAGDPEFGEISRCYTIPVNKLLKDPYGTLATGVDKIKDAMVPDPVKGAVPDIGNLAAT